MKKRAIKPKVLMDEDGICITNQQVSTAVGDYPLQEIEAVGEQVSKPMWGPLLLCVLGTINLAIGFQVGFWLDLVAAAVMFGAGLFWWIRGTKYVLTLKVPRAEGEDDSEVEVWFTRREAQFRRALESLEGLLDKGR